MIYYQVASGLVCRASLSPDPVPRAPSLGFCVATVQYTHTHRYTYTHTQPHYTYYNLACHNQQSVPCLAMVGVHSLLYTVRVSLRIPQEKMLVAASNYHEIIQLRSTISKNVL